MIKTIKHVDGSVYQQLAQNLVDRVRAEMGPLWRTSALLFLCSGHHEFQKPSVCPRAYLALHGRGDVNRNEHQPCPSKGSM
jgi:hypothetical protein